MATTGADLLRGDDGGRCPLGRRVTNRGGDLCTRSTNVGAGADRRSCRHDTRGYVHASLKARRAKGVRIASACVGGGTREYGDPGRAWREKQHDTGGSTASLIAYASTRTSSSDGIRQRNVLEQVPGRTGHRGLSGTGRLGRSSRAILPPRRNSSQSRRAGRTLQLTGLISPNLEAGFFKQESGRKAAF
jgi:hypothetical protein